jgi:porin
MKISLLKTLIITLFTINIALAQVNRVKENPFSFETSYIGEAFYNFNGGIKTGGTYLGMANIMIGFDTEKANFWKGGELFINAANTHGGEPSASFIGDYQVASNIEAGNFSFLQELWFKQTIGNVALVIGLQDLCVEFLSSENADLFLNSSCGVHSTISGNLPVPIFPLTSLGVQLHYSFMENLIFKIAVFDGVPEDFSINKHNVKWKLSKDDGYLLFSELSYYNNSENYPGAYKLGGYYHNPYIITIKDETSLLITEHYSQNYGIYLTVDQTLLKKQSGRELSSFFQASIKPKNINENWYYIGFGLNYKGIFTKRTDDILGIALAHSGINNDIGSETAIELTYKAQIGENFFIQPDLQYIINPAGTDTKLKNSLLAFLRFGINF